MFQNRPNHETVHLVYVKKWMTHVLLAVNTLHKEKLSKNPCNFRSFTQYSSYSFTTNFELNNVKLICNSLFCLTSKHLSLLYAVEKQALWPFLATHVTSLGYDKKPRAVKFLKMCLYKNMQDYYI
jgi:hypothetical protein